MQSRAGAGELLVSVLASLTRPLDPDDPGSLSVELVKAALKPVEALGRIYFRAEVRRLDLVPEGPALIVGNHNAGITFLEPFFMGARYYLERGMDTPLFFLAHDAMVDLPLLRQVLVRLGAVRAGYGSAEKVFERGGKLVIYPGGNKEAFRRFRDRHKVDLAGRTGFIKVALKAGVPIVPVVHIGGHETFFVLTPGEGLARALGLPRLVRSDTCAVFIGLPWGIFVGPMFHLPLPSKCVTEFCEPVDPGAMGYTARHAEDQEALKEIYDTVIGKMQSTMDRLASERKRVLLG